MPKLIFRKGQKVGVEILLDGEKFTLGRRKACEIPIADGKSSRNHAQIFRQGNRYYVRDLASRNGTFLNGERLAGDTELSYGDQVSIGGTVLEFVEESAGKPIDFEIPGYQLVERVGEGGMGVVYKARQVSMDRVVAIKVLSERYSKNAEFIDRFIREARAAGRLNHPNVIHVHDVSKAGERYFFSMEFVDGPSAKKLLKQKGRLPVAKCLEIITQAAKALEFAHENGIIHRDVKPDNIMLTSEGIVKIADLGIAKSFEDGEGLEPERDGKRKVLGTPHYMAPEQAMGKALDRRADVYSLGATFYHMLTGKTPFRGTTITELLKAHVHDKLAPVQSLNPEVPDPVCFVVERMMAKLPEKRYENMTRLLEDLERVSRDAAGAQIEQLAPEDSTIMRAMDAKAVAEARAAAAPAAPPRKSPVLGIILIAVAVLLALALVAVAYVVANRLKNPQGGGTSAGTGTGTSAGTAPAQSEPARMLKEARELLAAGKEDEAGRKAEELAGKFAASPEAVEAQKLVIQIKERQASLVQQEINKLVAAAEQAAKDKPDDLGAQKVAWDEVARKFPGTEAAKRAGEELARIQERKTAAEGEIRKELFKQKFAEARKKSEEALAAKDYVAAANAQTLLAAEFAGSDEGKQAEARAKEIEDAAAKPFADAVKASDEALEAGRFGAAYKPLKDLEASVKSAKWLEELPKKLEAVKARAKEEFDKEFKPVQDDAKAGRQVEAARAAKALAGRFAGTIHEAEAKTFAEGLERLPALARKIVNNIGRLGPKEISFAMETTLLPGKWRVASATEERVVLSSRQAGQDMESPLRWARLPPKDAYHLYLLYLDKPTAEDHRALAFFCTLHGLAAEAENHRKLAGGGS